jgi:hypothetical protein
MAGACGLYCGTCPIYLARRENDTDTLREMSRLRGVPVERVRCDGCLSDHMFQDCRHGFLRCAEERNVTWCFQCSDFPCKRLKDFIGIHVMNGISHHEHVIEDLQYMREHGVGEWVKKQAKRALCPKCGRTQYWFNRNCPKCGAKIR